MRWARAESSKPAFLDVVNIEPDVNRTLFGKRSLDVIFKIFLRVSRKFAAADFAEFVIPGRVGSDSKKYGQSKR
jgi:hypothetical protein